MNIRIPLTIIMLLISCFCMGQSSFLQDGKGESSLKVFDNEIAINSSDESISIQYFHRKTSKFATVTNKVAKKIQGNDELKLNETFYPSFYKEEFKRIWKDIKSGKTNLEVEINKYDDDIKEVINDLIEEGMTNIRNLSNNGLVWSYSLKFTANQGVSKLFDGGNFVPQVDAGITLGLNEVPDFSNYGKVVLRYGYIGAAFQRSEFKLFNEVSSILNDREFVGFSINGGYNIVGEWKNKSDKNSVTLLGLGLKAGKLNTFDDLKAVETSTITSLSDTSVLAESITSGFIGDYETFYGINLLADGYIFPSGWDNRVGLGTYARYNAIGNTSRLNLGLGTVITKDKKPTNVVLSLMFQFTDVFNNLEAEDSALFDRFGINLIAGYKL